MISMTFTVATAKTDESIQKNSGLSQGPVHPFGGRLTVRGRGTHCIATPRRIHHERAGRRGEAGLGVRHHVGRAVLDPGPPGHASVGIVPA
jgi:hypothetical protein